MGASGEDILLSQQARSSFPYSIECKSRHGIAVYAWLEQGDARDYKRIVFAKANHKEPIVIMYAKDFLALFHE